MEGKNNATTIWTLSLLKKLESLDKSIKEAGNLVHHNKFEALLSNVDEQ